MKKAFKPAALILVILVLIVFTTYGSHGLLHLREINNELAVLQKKNNALESEITVVSRDINDLKNQNFALEKKAREELGLSRPDEIVYIFNPKE